MDVEEQHRTVIAADRRQFTRLGNEVSIRCLAVGDVDDDRRKSRRMLLTPGLDNPGCVLERGAHRSGPFPIWVEPDWKFHILVHHSAGAIIRFLHSLFDAQRLIGQFTDRYQRAPAQFTAERWFTALFAVAQHTDMKVVVNRVRFGATDAQIVNELVEYRRQLLGLPSPAPPAPKGSSIDSDWSTKNKKQPGFLRLISASYAMASLHFFWHHENYDSLLDSTHRANPS